MLWKLRLVVVSILTAVTIAIFIMMMIVIPEESWIFFAWGFLFALTFEKASDIVEDVIKDKEEKLKLEGKKE